MTDIKDSSVLNQPLIIQGGKATAVIYGNPPDQAELSQIYALLDSPAHAGLPIRIMPDHHAGKGCVIGFTAPLARPMMIIPSLVGVDIGCGVMAMKLGGSDHKNHKIAKVESILPEFDRYLRKHVPAGFASLEKPSKRREWLYKWYYGHGSDWDSFETAVENLSQKVGTDIDKVWCSCGSLGGGNHFQDLSKDKDGNCWMVIHSGSRNFGLRVAEFHQRAAVKILGKKGGLEWLEGEDAESYLRDMRLAQKYAMLNRLVMLDVLADFFEVKLRDTALITSVHNYIGEDDVIRKGAVSAKDGEQLLIPLNMADGTLVGVGRGNPEWNNSAPHGAGRTMSRGDAKRSIPMADYKKRMEESGVWTSCISQGTLDESPQSYKPIDSILPYVVETMNVVDTLKPIYNFKAGGE